MKTRQLAKSLPELKLLKEDFTTVCDGLEMKYVSKAV
jgi:hypothetical protein